ncbi:uncharacterized protein [Garra rufa]|uniref:uncharacterized protein n=1 Tax=Garra rufa TaxID=137080 RepID=UPI003CCEDBA1
MGNFTLQCEEIWSRQTQVIRRMLSKSIQERPSIEECLESITCFTHQSGTKDNGSKNNEIEVRSHTSNPQQSEEIDILGRTDKEKPEGVCSDNMDSSSNFEEELSQCKMNNTEHQFTLEMSEEKMSVEEVSEEEMPEEEISEEVSEEDISEEEVSEEDISEEVSEEDISEEEVSDEDISEEEVSEEDISEEVSDEDISEEVVSKEEMYEAQAKGQVAEVIQGKSLWRKMDEDAGCSSHQQNIPVKTSSNTAHQRIYDKKNYCLYCEKAYVKIARHLTQRHSGKVEVAKALAQRKGSVMRNLLLTKIRNMGNYHHNISVLSTGKGVIVPKRQATYHSTSHDYLPCKFCYAMYVKTDLWRHHKRCKLQVKDCMPVNRKVQASCSLLLPMDCTVSSGLKKMIEDMTYDAVTQVVKSDQLILSLGERMFLRNGEVPRYRADIRNKMRELARLLMTARKFDKGIVTLKDLINPGKFNTVLESVKIMTGFDRSTNRFSVPSTALKLRHSLVKVSHILQGEALRQEDDALKSRAEHFSKLIELEWTIHVSSNALKTLYQKKWNSPQMLPLAEDIKKLQDHLKCLEETNKEALTDHPSQRSWSDLSQVTLTQLILFNRRREGEVSRMEIQTYLQRNNYQMQDEILESLSAFEKKLCENLTRVEVRGKRGRKVPILLPANVKESVDLLIKTREHVGISSSNPYIFARPFYGSQESIRGCDCLKRYAESCGAKNPENITSTKLRKHVATVSQLLNLQTHDLDQLATFMGHDIEVHREFYRLPEETLQMAKVGRILFALQSGISQFKGKSLEDITPNISFEEGTSDSESKDAESNKRRAKDNHLEKGTATSRKTVSGEASAYLRKPPLPLNQKGKSRKAWTEVESKMIEHHFKNFLKKMKVPGKNDCERFLNENQSLMNKERDWIAVKYFVHNRIITMKRNLCQKYTT